VEQPIRLKRGAVREDGKIFYAYRSCKRNSTAIWLSPESYKRVIDRDRARSKRLLQNYKEKQNSLPPEERNYKGKFIPETGLYFAYVNTSGVPIYKNEAEYNKWLERRRSTHRRFHARCKQLPAPSCLLGDPHPTIPNLFVKRIYGHKVTYGTLEEATRARLKRNESCKKHRDIHKERRKKRLQELRNARMNFLKENPHLRRSRGDIDPVLGQIFWGYSNMGNELWYDPARFAEKKAKFSAQRQKRYYKKKSAKLAEKKNM
jgi:hypothetical protein